MYVRVPAITNSVCNSLYSNSAITAPNITDSMICAGGVGGKGVCAGDRGGPLVCNDVGKAIIAGTVSWSFGCAEANYPGVYSRTTAALDWIKSTMVSMFIAQLLS